MYEMGRKQDLLVPAAGSSGRGRGAGPAAAPAGGPVGAPDTAAPMGWVAYTLPSK
jgi:hypothetical protein